MNNDDKSAELAAVYASKSWRLTAPLRESAAWLRRMHPRSLLGRLVRWAGRDPEIRRLGGQFLLRFPTLRERLRQVVNARPAESALSPSVVFTMPVSAMPVGAVAVGAVAVGAVAVGEVLLQQPVTVSPEQSVATAPLAQPSAAELRLNAGARQVLAQMRAALRPGR